MQIDLPPYTDYASLEQKLTLAVECVSVPTRCFTFIYHIASAGRQLALVKNRGDLAYLNGLRSFQIPYPLSHSDARLPSHVSRACLQCLPRLPLVCCDSRLHDASISLLNSWFGSVQLSYYSMSRGSLAMCNQSISSEISLGSSLYQRVPVVSFQKKPHISCWSQHSPCIRAMSPTTARSSGKKSTNNIYTKLTVLALC